MIPDNGTMDRRLYRAACYEYSCGSVSTRARAVVLTFRSWRL